MTQVALELPDAQVFACYQQSRSSHGHSLVAISGSRYSPTRSGVNKTSAQLLYDSLSSEPAVLSFMHKFAYCVRFVKVLAGQNVGILPHFSIFCIICWYFGTFCIICTKSGAYLHTFNSFKESHNFQLYFSWTRRVSSLGILGTVKFAKGFALKVNESYQIWINNNIKSTHTQKNRKVNRWGESIKRSWWCIEQVKNKDKSRQRDEPGANCEPTKTIYRWPISLGFISRFEHLILSFNTLSD